MPAILYCTLKKESGPKTGCNVVHTKRTLGLKQPDLTLVWLHVFTVHKSCFKRSVNFVSFSSPKLDSLNMTPHDKANGLHHSSSANMNGVLDPTSDSSMVSKKTVDSKADDSNNSKMEDIMDTGEAKELSMDSEPNKVATSEPTQNGATSPKKASTPTSEESPQSRADSTSQSATKSTAVATSRASKKKESDSNGNSKVEKNGEKAKKDSKEVSKSADSNSTPSSSSSGRSSRKSSPTHR